jgi:hypothetical protein
VLVICVQFVPPLVVDSHLRTLPVFPDKVNVPLFGPVQNTVTSGETVPPSGAGITVTVTLDEFEQPLAPIPVTV